MGFFCAFCVVFFTLSPILVLRLSLLRAGPFLPTVYYIYYHHLGTVYRYTILHSNLFFYVLQFYLIGTIYHYTY